MRILGIDPGTVVTGYGLVDSQRGKLFHIENGGIFPSKGLPLHERIGQIHDRVESLLQKFQPDHVAMEDIFISKNAASALKLGHARGAVMVAARRAKIPFHEYTANQVKLAITGYGHASKEQIQKMVQMLLKLPEIAFSDASDALAVAICHINSHKLLKKVQNR